MLYKDCNSVDWQVAATWPLRFVSGANKALIRRSGLHATMILLRLERQHSKGGHFRLSQSLQMLVQRLVWIVLPLASLFSQLLDMPRDSY